MSNNKINLIMSYGLAKTKRQIILFMRLILQRERNVSTINRTWENAGEN